jgi:hypothetical protein
VFKSVLFVLVFASDFLVVMLRAVGRAVRNTTKFRSILLEGHEEPELRFDLRATYVAISVITPDRRFCQTPTVWVLCFIPASHQQSIFFLLIMTPRSTQEPLVADKLALMLVPTAANQDLYLFGVRLIGSQRGDQLQQQYYYKQRLRKMATTCLNRHFDSDTLCMMTI